MSARKDKPTIDQIIADEVRKDEGMTPTFPFSEREFEKKAAGGEAAAEEAESRTSERAGLKSVVKDALGLPPGDGTPHGRGRREHDPDVPEGALTSADREPNRPAAREHEQ